MALGGWLVLATTPALSQILCVYIVTFLIGLGGLHHSIAGSVEMFTALLISDHFTLLQGLRFIGLAMLGNLIGGSVFVAILNYGHIRKTQGLV
jgi:formate/nitrite transporter FocA (FNT family)